MNYHVEVYSIYLHSGFEQIFLESFSELTKQLDSMGAAPKTQKEKIVFESLVMPAIKNGLLILLAEDKKVIGYEFVSVSPYDSSTVIAAFTFIKKEYRGQKLSYLLREKMLELVKKKGIRRVFFTILNDNEESLGNLEAFKKMFAIKEVSRTFYVEI